MSLICRTCPSSVLYLSVLLSPLSAFVLKPFPLGQLSFIYLFFIFFTLLTLYFPAPLTAPRPYTGYILNLIRTDTNVEKTRGGT